MKTLSPCLLTLCLLAAPAAAGPAAPDGEALEDVIGVLYERGLIDGKQRDRILRKHHAQQAEAVPSMGQRLFEGWRWNGDLRLRYEGFRYDSDSIGGRRQNQHRFRYRARIGFEKAVNDWIDVGLRLTSGPTTITTSTNQTIGDGEDFDRDEIAIDRAYARFTLDEHAGIRSQIVAGKIANPLLWKYGPDWLLWDHDLSPEGIALMTSLPLSEATTLFGNFAAFIIDENEQSNDPKVFAVQLGGTHSLGDGVRAGLRASGYEWRTLDQSFVARATEFGNLASAFDSKARIAELTGFVGFEPHPDWPLLLHGVWIKNYTADSAVFGGVRVGNEDMAWGAGLELGSASAVAALAGGYYYVEANAVVATFTDSNLFDGRTNRRGWFLRARRNLWDGVAFQVEYFDSDSIANSAPFLLSAGDADRKRLRTDLIFNF